MGLELVHQGHLTLPQMVHKMSHAPALLFGIQERGFLREGYWADMILVDPNPAMPISRDQVLYKCGWSPLEGDILQHSVVKSFVNGELKYDQGRFMGAPNGQRLAFNALK